MRVLAFLLLFVLSTTTSAFQQGDLPFQNYEPPVQRKMAEKSPIDVLENHLNAVRNAMSIRNNTSLYQLVNNGTDLDSFFALSSANVKSLRFNHKIHKAVNSVKSVVSQIEGTVTFTYSHSEGTNSYLTKVFLQKNSKSPTGWKLVKAKICTDAECSKVPS